MVDFKKLLGGNKKVKETDPLEIFKRLDKESGKEYLRPHQETILSQWNARFLDRKDTLVKLHTGQGKTLVGLLMLQSSLHSGSGPAVYLCPNKYLIRQTIEEAKSFGIPIVEFPEIGSNPPLEFSNSEAILITTCKKLFNGKSIFGVTGSNREEIKIGTIVMDDAHKCLDIIRDSFSIKISKKQGDRTNQIYHDLWSLFEPGLMRQASGTCIDIKADSEAHMAVPFWIWNEKIADVLEILHDHKDSDDLRFVWDLIKDKLQYSTCVFSGQELEISPRLVPVEMIPSFVGAKRRIFLSATLTEDAFLVRDLGLNATSVGEPLMLEDVKYSGERMVLIPTLVSSYLTREKIIKWVSRYSEKHGDFGVVALVPSRKHAKEWGTRGATTTNVQNLGESIARFKESIKNESAIHVTVLVNAYDGVDLPDSTCRILCLDSMPAYSSLNDKHAQAVRTNSNVIRRQLAQRIEQGIGRGIRGPSDWCVIVATGNKLTSFLSETAKSEFLSNETKKQIEIAKKLADEMTTEEGDRLAVVEEVVNQCVSRDEGWKAFYHENMSQTEKNPTNENFLNVSILERDAELLFQSGQYQKAADTIRKIIDISQEDHGWYFQLMATYLYPLNKLDSMDKQVKAFYENNQLSRPEEGITYSRLANASDGREKLVIEWIKQCESPTELILKVTNILDNVSFGISSDSFEDGVEQLGRMLGFPSQRPEKISGKGSDNLWNIKDKHYWVISCKNMIMRDRDFISKSETGQLNNDMAWFSTEYQGCTSKAVFIHPSSTLNSDAFLNTGYVMTPQKLDSLKRNVKNFYKSLAGIRPDELSAEIVSRKLAEYNLDILHINSDYFESIA